MKKNDTENSSIAENEELIDAICDSCVGVLQRLYVESSGIFTWKIYEKWVYKCTHCPFQSKIYCGRIKDLQKK